MENINRKLKDYMIPADVPVFEGEFVSSHLASIEVSESVKTDGMSFVLLATNDQNRWRAETLRELSAFISLLADAMEKRDGKRI